VVNWLPPQNGLAILAALNDDFRIRLLLTLTAGQAGLLTDGGGAFDVANQLADVMLPQCCG
jgi:hypothetical protein